MSKLSLKISGKIMLEGTLFKVSNYSHIQGTVKRLKIESEQFPVYEGSVIKENGIYYPNGEGSLEIRHSESFQFKAIGNWQHGKLPIGKLEYKNGLYYIGYLKLLKQNGFGALYYENGKKKWEGIWENGFIKEGEQYNKNGTLKYTGSFYKGKFNGSGILYQQNGIKQGYFENGVFKISKQDMVKKIKVQQNIKKFMSQNRQEHLNQVTKQDIKDYLQKYGKIKKDGTKQQLIQSLRKFKQELNKQQQSQQQKIDPLTLEEIQNPVIANDGVIYDKSSLQNILGQNLKYEYNQNRELIPIYPILMGGVPVTNYYTLQQLRQNQKIPKRQQLKTKLERF